jgi:phosphopentomutase
LNDLGTRRVLMVVADGVGIGGAPDAAEFGTPGANTIGNLAAHLGGLAVPTLAAWGLGRLTDVKGLPPGPPGALVGRLVESSAANDSTVGHWELMGLVSHSAPPTYPDGFPPGLLAEFARAIGLRGAEDVLGNVVANGEATIERFGREHLATGHPIVYTSSDSVFQVAAHTAAVPLTELYRWCETARGLLTGAHAVGRVIARPFEGQPGAFRRLGTRRDWALPPTGLTAMELLDQAGVPVVSVGKIGDIFAHQHVGEETHPGDNPACMRAAAGALRRPGPLLVFTNLVDFDSHYGHARRPVPFAQALSALDTWLAETTSLLGEGDRIILTADHGNDPTYTATTDHTRERVPLLAWGPDLPPADLGEAPMSALGPAVCELFGVDPAPLRPPSAATDLSRALRAA